MSFRAEKSKLLKSDCTKAKQSCAAEAKKLKKATDSCKRLEKKVQELEKSLQKAEETSTNLEENFKYGIDDQGITKNNCRY